MPKYLLIVPLFFVISTSIGQSIQFNPSSWDEIVLLARESDQLIFVDGYTDWCASCKMMDEYVFTQKNGGQLYNDRFINVKMDMEKDIGPLFVARYNVTKYPTFLYLTWDGTLVHQSNGYKDMPALIQEADMALDPQRMLTAFKERFDSGDRNSQFLYHYTYLLADHSDAGYQQLVPLYLKTQYEWSTPENLQYIFDFVDDFDSDLFQHMAENKLDYGAVVGSELFNEKFNYFVKQALDNEGQPISLDRREAIYHVAYPTIADQMITEYKLDYYTDEGDDEAYANTAYYYYTTYYGTEEEILQDIALIDQYVDSDEARQFVKSTYEKMARDDNSPQSWLTLAEYNLRQNRFEQAKDLGKKAKKMASSDHIDTDIYKAFLKEVRKEKKQAKRAMKG